jgi:hypothetical protein
MGKYKDKKGYVRSVAEGHARAYLGRVYEHILVMEEYLGRSLPKGTIVHHGNRIRSDNRIENLLLLRNQDDHRALHRAMQNGDTAIVREFEDWSKEFMAKLKSGLSEAECFRRLAVVKNESTESHVGIEKFVVRRNKLSNKMFIEFIEELLISPAGKDVELDLERFGEPEEVVGSELTEKQLTVYQNKMKARESKIINDEKKLDLEERLFFELKEERKRLAVRKNIPPYMIFEDKTLTEMSEMMPVSESAMLQVSGVGPKKFQWYGRYFIAVVKKFKKDFNIV